MKKKIHNSSLEYFYVTVTVLVFLRAFGMDANIMPRSNIVKEKEAIFGTWIIFACVMDRWEK